MFKNSMYQNSLKDKIAGIKNSIKSIASMLGVPNLKKFLTKSWPIYILYNYSWGFQKCNFGINGHVDLDIDERIPANCKVHFYFEGFHTSLGSHITYCHLSIWKLINRLKIKLEINLLNMTLTKKLYAKELVTKYESSIPFELVKKKNQICENLAHYKL